MTGTRLELMTSATKGEQREGRSRAPRMGTQRVGEAKCVGVLGDRNEVGSDDISYEEERRIGSKMYT